MVQVKSTLSVPSAVHPPAQEGQSRKYAALDLARKGLWVIPLCWPDEEGHCACPKNHTGHDVGKAPLTSKGVNDSSNSVKTIWEWWDHWPQANIGVDADRSGLVVIAPDSPEAHQRFLELGLPETAVVQSGGGEGHFHYLCQRPEGTPLINVNKPNDYDIQPRGYMVGVGSRHQSGRLYTWVTDYQWRDVEDLPFAPEWALAEIQQKWDARIAAPEIDVDFNAVELRPGLVKGTLAEWWNGEKSATHVDGSTDRSLTLFIIGRLLGKQGASPEEIVSALRDRDEALGFCKYSQRKDGGIKEYAAIAQAVASSAVEDLPWEQVVDEVAHDPATEGYYMEGADGPRRRLPLPTDRGGIDKIRSRLGKIWLAAHHRLGNTETITRSHQCGGLSAHECESHHISAPPDKERYNCKQRLHPRCLGTNVRKVFYLPKTKGRTKLDGEGPMDISICRLGHYDVGEDPFHWSPNIRRQLKQVRKGISKLARRKSTPEAFKNSFVGLRADLHQGYLTIDVVIAGGRDPGMSGWLKDAFAEIAAEPVRVETLSPRDARGVINEFGNLMSSAFSYSNVDECLAMLEALKSWRIVQPQGKFLRKPDVAEDQCRDVSIGSPQECPIETSRHPAPHGGGDASPSCPECGKSTRRVGFKTGRWVKAIGTWSRKHTWLLLEDAADAAEEVGNGNSY